MTSTNVSCPRPEVRLVRSRTWRYNLHILPKRPSECSTTELDAFEDLLREGGEVTTDELRHRMLEAEWLVFAVEGNGTLAGVAALKRPSKYYKEMVFHKARTPENPRGPGSTD
jgi:hypothetical protein